MSKNKNFKGKKTRGKVSPLLGVEVTVKITPTVFTLKVGKSTHKLTEAQAQRLYSDLADALDKSNDEPFDGWDD